MQRQFADKSSVNIYIEAGWKHKKIFARHDVKVPDRFEGHPEAAENYKKNVWGRKVKDIGKNHAAGELLAEFLTCMGYTVTLLKPVATKWTPDEMETFTGIATKDQEKIDAARQCYGK